MIPLIDRPGCYTLTAERYHADPCPAPSLSASVAHVLLDRSPRHAWQAHPRLNPSHERTHRTEFDLGAAAHRLVLGAGQDVVLVDADSYRSAAAKQARDDAYAAGRIPVLPHQMAQVEAMAAAARVQIAQHEECAHLFVRGAGKAEQTLVWQEETAHGPVWCRAMLDWLPARGAIFPDYKSTGGSANPETWTRRLFDLGYDVQAAFYRRGIRAVLNVDRPIFVFVAQEIEPPYALCVVGLDPATLDFAERRVADAIALWSDCLHHGRWPGYPARICWAETPAYVEHRQAGRDARRQFMADRGKKPTDALLHWQAPA